MGELLFPLEAVNQQVRVPVVTVAVVVLQRENRASSARKILKSVCARATRQDPSPPCPQDCIISSIFRDSPCLHPRTHACRPPIPRRRAVHRRTHPPHGARKLHTGRFVLAFPDWPCDRWFGSFADRPPKRNNSAASTKEPPPHKVSRLVAIGLSKLQRAPVEERKKGKKLKRETQRWVRGSAIGSGTAGKQFCTVVCVPLANGGVKRENVESGSGISTDKVAASRKWDQQARWPLFGPCKFITVPLNGKTTP